MAASLIRVEVAAALPDRQMVVSLQVEEGTTLLEAIEQSDIAEKMPELEIDPARVGIFGKRRPADTPLADGDRVEIYRPLTADPKEVRRRMAELERRGAGRED
jgi:hypothetical protein